MKLELESHRLRLRLVTVQDLLAIHELTSIHEVERYNTLGVPKNLETTKARFMPLIEANAETNIQHYTFAIEALSDHAFLGIVGFKLDRKHYRSAEVWYKLLPKYWGMGYATETVKRILEFGFESLNLHRIHAGCAVKNMGSVRVLEKVGMRNEGISKATLPLVDGWSDHYNFAILEHEFKRSIK